VTEVLHCADWVGRPHRLGGQGLRACHAGGGALVLPGFVAHHHQRTLAHSSSTRMVAALVRAGQTQSLLTASTRVDGWNGLVIQARAPAALPSAFLLSCDSVVSMITGVNL
jgi:hypothetical protein